MQKQLPGNSGMSRVLYEQQYRSMTDGLVKKQNIDANESKHEEEKSESGVVSQIEENKIIINQS